MAVSVDSRRRNRRLTARAFEITDKIIACLGCFVAVRVIPACRRTGTIVGTGSDSLLSSKGEWRLPRC